MTRIFKAIRAFLLVLTKGEETQTPPPDKQPEIKRHNNPLPPSPVYLRNPLSQDDRLRIMEWLSKPESGLVLAAMELHRPPSSVGSSGSEDDQRRAANQLSHLEGWDHYRTTLLSLAKPPREVEEIGIYEEDYTTNPYEFPQEPTENEPETDE